jgi:hypothetical protein
MVSIQRYTNSWVLPLAVISLVIAMPTARAAVYTYDLVSVSGLQNGAGLVGNITVNTGTTTSVDGNYYLGHASIIAWNFTVSPTVGVDFSGSHTGVNPSATGTGSTSALYATPTTLSVVEGGSLLLASGLLDPSQDQLDWNNQSSSTGLYLASDGIATWFEVDKTALDSNFSSYAIPGDIGNWVIATAVPEPSVTLMSLLGALFLMRRRR